MYFILVHIVHKYFYLFICTFYCIFDYKKKKKITYTHMYTIKYMVKKLKLSDWILLFWLQLSYFAQLY